jgi:hypothetical protein
MPDKHPKRTTASKEIPLSAIVAYHCQGLNSVEIAALLGCTGGNIRARLATAEVNTFESFRKNKDVAFEYLQGKIYDALTPEKIKSMSAGTMITAVGILEDKIRDIRGQNDSNIKPMVLIVKGDANVQINADRDTNVLKAPLKDDSQCSII